MGIYRHAAYTCPVCGRPYRPQDTETHNSVERIKVKVKGYGLTTVPRFVDTTFMPCGCTESFDRKEERVIPREEAKA